MQKTKRKVDTLDDIRQKQLRLAERIAKAEVPHVMAGMDNLEEYDPELLPLALCQQIEKDVFDAIICYTEWVAGRIYRSKRFKGQYLPDPNEITCARIADRAGTTTTILAGVIMLLRREKHIPILGSVTDGLLRPNKKAILRWASLHDWSQPEEETPKTTTTT